MKPENQNTSKFDTWIAELIEVQKAHGWTDDAAESLDKEAFRQYFEEGETPTEAFIMDCNADPEI